MGYALKPVRQPPRCTEMAQILDPSSSCELQVRQDLSSYRCKDDHLQEVGSGHSYWSRIREGLGIKVFHSRTLESKIFSKKMNGSSSIGIGNILNTQLYSFCYLKTFKIGLDSKKLLHFNGKLWTRVINDHEISEFSFMEIFIRNYPDVLNTYLFCPCPPSDVNLNNLQLHFKQYTIFSIICFVQLKQFTQAFEM